MPTALAFSERYGPTVIGKYTKGIGQVEARFPTDDEDPISFAMTVVHRLLERMEAKGGACWVGLSDGVLMVFPWL